MRSKRRVSLVLLAASGAYAYHQSEFEGLWEQVPQTCINVRAGDTTRDSTAKEMPSWSGYGDVSYRCENDPYCEGRFRVSTRPGVPAEVALSAMSLESAPQVEFDLHPDERIEIDDDDDVLRRELGI